MMLYFQAKEISEERTLRNICWNIPKGSIEAFFAKTMTARCLPRFVESIFANWTCQPFIKCFHKLCPIFNLDTHSFNVYNLKYNENGLDNLPYRQVLAWKHLDRFIYVRTSNIGRDHFTSFSKIGHRGQHVPCFRKRPVNFRLSRKKKERSTFGQN